MGRHKEEQFETRFVSIGPSGDGVLHVHRRTAELSAPKYSQTVHWHDHFELELVEEGSAIHAVNGQRYRVTPGSCYLMTPTDLHTLLPDPEAPSSRLTVYSFSFSSTLLGGTPSADVTELPTPIAARVEGELQAWFLHTAQLLLEESRKQAPYSSEILRATFLGMLLMFLRLSAEQCPVRRKEPPAESGKGESAYIRQAVAYIRYHFRESDLTLKQIAGAVYLSPNYFGAVFKRLTGMPCLSYIKKLRMEFAAGLLLQSPLTVAEISEKSGYVNISYFVSDFRRYYGDPPQRYRDLHLPQEKKPETPNS